MTRLDNTARHQLLDLDLGLELDLSPANAVPAAFVLDERAFATLTPRDRDLFTKFGVGCAATPTHAAIHLPIEEHAAKNPSAIAVEHEGERITYGELDIRANVLAAYLVECGVQPGDRVALFLQRSIPMIVGILAAHKAGAAYVPQHVGVAPDAQLQLVAQASRARVILTLGSLRDQLPEFRAPVVAIDELLAARAGVPAIAPRVPADSKRGCFVLFTSGTTGVPNGVEVTHGNVCNLLLTAPGNLGIRPGMRVSQILSIAFDMAAWEILGCLSHGGTLIIRGASIEEAVSRADVVIATPSILAKLPMMPHVCVVAVAGEPCPRPLADAWSAFATFYNGCGPTEVTIVNTMQHYTPKRERLTIGGPTPNNTVYVLDEELRPLPIGETGEMWAGGDCVSTGYLDNDILNADRYRDDPFLGGGRKMFRTRDLGRWTPDGELEHLGRTDDQVKVRGFRVELDSVSRSLESTPGCTQAVTLKFDNRTLVAFVCPATFDVRKAREAASSKLPYYAVPELIHAIDALPLTGRGKIDKRILLELAAALLEERRNRELDALSRSSLDQLGGAL